MAEENKDLTPDTSVGADNAQYIDAIKKLKASSVDKEAYDKLLKENKMLLDSIVESKPATEQPETPKVDVKALRKDLLTNENLSNLDYAKKALALRNELIKEGKDDPFLPTGHKIIYSADDEVIAQRVADALEHCVEVADGDSAIFTNELQRIMIDSMPIRRKR